MGSVKTILLGAGRTYLVDGELSIPAGCTIIGQGESSVIKTMTNAPVLIINGEDISLRNFRILGSGAGSSPHGIQNGDPGVTESGFARVRICDVTFHNLGGDGHVFSQNPFNAFAGPLLSNCVAIGCDRGFVSLTRGEYIAHNNCEAEDCGKGFYNAAGNVGINGCISTYNDVGLEIASGVNAAHGIVSNSHINHNTKAIVVGAIGAQGMTFANVHVYQGSIELTNSQGVRFVGGVTDVDSYLFDGAIGTVMGSTLGTAYANSISEINGANTDWAPSRSLTGTHPSWIGRRAAGVFTRNNETFVGTPPGYTAAAQCESLRLYCRSGGTGYLGSGSTARVFWSDGYFAPQVPVTGGGVSNYGVHGVGTQAMGDTNRTPAASVYQYGTIKTTGALTANRNLTLPAQTDATAVTKWINNSCTGSFSVVVGDGGAGTTVTVGNGKSALVLFDSRGATRLTADV